MSKQQLYQYILIQLKPDWAEIELDAEHGIIVHTNHQIHWAIYHYHIAITDETIKLVEEVELNEQYICYGYSQDLHEVSLSDPITLTQEHLSELTRIIKERSTIPTTQRHKPTQR